MKEFGLSEEEAKVRFWYDGFWGKYTGIYNPWSILNYSDKKIFNVYWANTSANTLISNLLQGANPDIKSEFEELLKGDKKAMNAYMNKIALETICYFDTGSHPSQAEPERFYHGFVLGLMVDLRDRYVITSNRESGFGRYDIVLMPKGDKDDAIIIEFKVYDAEDEQGLLDTVESALKQIESQRYEEGILAQEIPAERIRKYGFAFEGKRVLIG